MPPSRDRHRDTVSRVIVSVPPPIVSLMTMLMANMSREWKYSRSFLTIIEARHALGSKCSDDGIPELCTTEYWDAMDHLSAH